MNTFCTIITSNYFFYAQALYDSLDKFDQNLSFHVLIVDEFSEELSYKNIFISRLEDVIAELPADYELISKYYSDKESNLRWALKPLFLKYLLLEMHFEKTIFLDPDLYFFNNPSFLFDELNQEDVLITPHWRSKDPFKDSGNFDSLFTGGLFNAGFFACNKNAIDILNWWLKVCSYRMIKNDGFYVDQAYLNLMPIYFTDQVKILKHKGCNVANWNRIECKRSIKNNEVIIDDKFPIVFIHFTNGTINMIKNGSDSLLSPLLEEYKQALENHNNSFEFSIEKSATIPNKEKLIYKLKSLVRW